jgi:hypothetical protein
LEESREARFRRCGGLIQHLAEQRGKRLILDVIGQKQPELMQDLVSHGVQGSRQCRGSVFWCRLEDAGTAMCYQAGKKGEIM